MKTTASDGQPVLLRRPIQLLYPLELSDSSEPSTERRSSPGAEPLAGNESSIEQTGTKLRRSKRAAAQRGDERRKACMFELNDD